MDGVSGGRVFTTLGVKPHHGVHDATEYADAEDDDGESLPAVNDNGDGNAARKAKLVGDLSDCSDLELEGEAAATDMPAMSPCSAWDSEEEYPLETRVLSRPLSQVLQDAEAWQRERDQGPPQPRAEQGNKKARRRGGKSKKARAHWTEAQRLAEKNSIAYANRTALVRAARQTKRLDERRHTAPSGALKHVDGSDQYASSFTVAGGHLAVQQALGPPEECNEYVRELVKRDGFTYVPNASCAQVFTDADGVIYAVKVPQPTGDDWPETVRYFTECMHKLRTTLKLSHKANVNHLRGDFVHMTWGTSHGGGRKHPTTIAPDWLRNKDELVAFFADPKIQRVCRHMQSTL
ncbi:hypothetical protein AURDEDRAFT_130489 [Auricularia subglabra TFB-10046 SS5]|nr:hypothetical protein AURDEDRAFT_130489 [Auricularia subglabra TFB-10046 SS5]